MQISAYFLVVVVLIAVMIGILILTHRYLDMKAAKEVFIAVLLVLFALLCFAVSLLLTSERPKFFFHELKFLSFAFLPPYTLRMYLIFSDQSALLTRKRWILLNVIPCITVIAALTNHYHHFFRTSMSMMSHLGVVYTDVEPSWWFWVHSIYSYILFFAGIIILTQAYYRKPRIYRDQTGLLILTCISAVAVGMAAVTGLFVDYGDLALIACSVVSIFQYITIVRYSPRRVIQLASSLVISDIDSPVLIFDHVNRLIDVNKSAAAHMNELKPVLMVGSEPVYESNNIDGSVKYLRKSDIYVRISDKQIYDKHGQISGRVVVLDDVTVSEKTAQRLAYIATHDDLTGLRNRQAFHFALRKLQTADLPVCVVCVNIVGMKLINAIFGNEYGDTVIIRAAKAIQNATTDCARLNGDEFGLIIKNASITEAEAFIENINQKLAAARDGLCEVYLSKGVTVLSDLSQNVDATIGLAMSSMRKNHSNAGVYAPSFMDTLRKELARFYDTTDSRTNQIVLLCEQLAEHFSVSGAQLDNLRLLAAIHDIGLLSAPPDLLKNAGNLTNEQWEELKLHTVKGYSIALSMPSLSMIADEILSHHERYDGYGYPNGRKGDDIPILARILAAVEYFVDAPPDNALAMLQKQSGTQLDPMVVDAIAALQR